MNTKDSKRCCLLKAGKCTALIETNCVGCAFFKTREKKIADDKKTIIRLRKLGLIK